MQPWPIVALLAFAAAACSDPVHDSAVDALGGELEGVPKGPDHRPGQPCLECHGGEGPASFVMSFGGTAYVHLNQPTPARGATIRVVDASGHTFETRTNQVGNFWIPAGRFEPVFPVNAAITLGSAARVMRTTMRLDGSCNACHGSPASSSSPGHIWVLSDSVNP